MTCVNVSTTIHTQRGSKLAVMVLWSMFVNAKCTLRTTVAREHVTTTTTTKMWPCRLNLHSCCIWTGCFKDRDPVTTCRHLLSWEQLWCIKTAIKQIQACSQFVNKWGQACIYRQSTYILYSTDNMSVNWDKLMKITNFAKFNFRVQPEAHRFCVLCHFAQALAKWHKHSAILL